MNDTNSESMSQESNYTLNRVQSSWYIVSRSDELKDAPLQVKLWGVAYVLYRNEKGVVCALLDRCPHRNVPLSAGKCDQGKIRCGYHGWLFGDDGQCVEIPALTPESPLPTVKTSAFPVIEAQGYIWIFPSEEEPQSKPFVFPYLDKENYVSIRYQTDFNATVYCTAENILDVPHTNVLHKGLFRKDQRKQLDVQVSRYRDRVICEYLNESPPSGVVGKLLTRGASRVFHFDRFILPSIAEVEYSLESGQTLVTTSFLTPVSDFVTRMYTVVSLSKSIWTSMIGPAVRPMIMKIVQQDADMLKLLTETTRSFGEERFFHSRVDFLGPSIQSLMKKAAQKQISTLEDIESAEPDSVRTESFLA